MTATISTSKEVFELYSKNKSELNFQGRSDNDFLLFLIDATSKAISAVKTLSPLYEAILKKSDINPVRGDEAVSHLTVIPFDKTYDVKSPIKGSTTPKPFFKDMNPIKVNKSPAAIKELNFEWGLKKENAIVNPPSENEILSSPLKGPRSPTFDAGIKNSNQSFPMKSPRNERANISSPSRKFFEEPKIEERVGEMFEEFDTCIAENTMICYEDITVEKDLNIIDHRGEFVKREEKERNKGVKTNEDKKEGKCSKERMNEEMEEGMLKSGKKKDCEENKEKEKHSVENKENQRRITDCGDKLCKFCPSYDELAGTLHDYEKGALMLQNENTVFEVQHLPDTKPPIAGAPDQCHEMVDLHLSYYMTNTHLEEDLQNQTFYSWREWSTVCARDNTTVCMVSPKVVIPDRIKKLSDSDLRNELIAKGAHPGPITPGTRKVYQEYLMKIETRPINPDDSLEGYPRELVSCLRGQPQADWSEPELAMVKEFQNPALGRNYRQGTKKCHFNYLLIDPRVADDLPKLSESLHPVEVFKLFIKSVFYVGKGKQSRPYGHLFEASQKAKDNAKVRKIRDIWSCGRGVVSLHVFSNTIAEEAFTREGAMISAIGMKKLTNEKQGEFYGISKTWSAAKRRGVGVALLYKAYLTLLNEGHREIGEKDFR